MVVALRKESVDRNGMEVDGVSYDVWSLSARRAWIEISFESPIIEHDLSLSARRAWIEIMGTATALKTSRVALRKESVDRNLMLGRLKKPCITSLSARRAWIEIDWLVLRSYATVGRSPQGERG